MACSNTIFEDRIEILSNHMADESARVFNTVRHWMHTNDNNYIKLKTLQVKYSEAILIYSLDNSNANIITHI